MDIEEVRKLFANDRFATEAAGAVVDEVTDDTAVCSLDIADIHKNAAGNVMGGVMFTLADFAFAVATNRSGCLVVTVSSTVEFIGSAKGTRLIATATPQKIGRSLCFYDIEVRDDLGNLVAMVTTVGKRTSVEI
ncbi:MAG: PaaI family thioesterase [Coriobacteriales bacterium]